MWKESNGNKYLTLVPADESKDTLKKYEKLWSKIKELIRLIVINFFHDSSKNCDTWKSKLIQLTVYLWKIAKTL